MFKFGETISIVIVNFLYRALHTKIELYILSLGQILRNTPTLTISTKSIQVSFHYYWKIEIVYNFIQTDILHTILMI